MSSFEVLIYRLLFLKCLVDKFDATSKSNCRILKLIVGGGSYEPLKHLEGWYRNGCFCCYLNPYTDSVFKYGGVSSGILCFKLRKRYKKGEKKKLHQSCDK